MTRTTIVIGGGLNGLVAATILARRGRQVHLMEQAETLGGMAGGDTAAPRMAHLLYNLSPLLRKELGFDPHRWPFRTVSLPTVLLCETGAHVVIKDRVPEWVDGSAHPQAAAYRSLVTRIAKYGDVLRRLAEMAPPGAPTKVTSAEGLQRMMTFGGMAMGLRALGKPEMRRFLQVMLSNAYDLILDEMPDGPLAGLLAADAVRGAAMGPRSPGTVFGLIYRYGHGGTVHLPLGGMQAVIGGFADAARTAGVAVHTGTGAAQIVIDADRVVGVQTTDGQRIDGSTVLTSTGPMAAARLVGLDHFDIEAARRFRNIRARGTVAKLNLRLRALPQIPGLPDRLLGSRMVIAPSAEAVEQAFNPAKYGEMSVTPILEVLLPGVTDPAQDPGLGRTVSVIAQFAPSDLSGGWSDEARQRLLTSVLDRLGQVAPDVPGLVEDAEILTPADIEARTGAPGGHWHHAEMGLDQLLSVRPANGIGRYALGPKGVYLCGASAHPGGDLMGLSGRNAAMAALESEG